MNTGVNEITVAYDPAGERKGYESQGHIPGVERDRGGRRLYADAHVVARVDGPVAPHWKYEHAERVSTVTSMTMFIPSVDDAIWRLRPDFAALSIVVRGGRNGPSEPADARPLTPAPAWAESHLESWRDAYKAFGAKPQRTPCSAEALCRRLERDGALPRINAVVDLYNRLSVDFVLPVGGEDLASYVGTPRLIRAVGDETFETSREGQPWVETVDRGEVVWRDDVGVTCRRWNWRQSVRTRLDVGARDMWFVLERLHPMPLASLDEAGDRLVGELRRLAPGAAISNCRQKAKPR